MPDNKFVRFRFSVPRADQDVLAWAQAQANLSISLRSLIRDSIRAHGIVDATCLPVTPVQGPETAARSAAVQEPIRPKMRPHAATATRPPVEAPVAPAPAPAAGTAAQPVAPPPSPAPVTPPSAPAAPAAAANPGRSPKQDQMLADMLQS